MQENLDKYQPKPNLAFRIFIFIFIFVIGILVFFALTKKELHDGEPSEQITSAWLQFRMGEYNQAIRIFERTLEKVPENSELHLQALYGLACSQWLKQMPYGDKEAAAESFNKIISQSPQNELAAWSMLALVRMKHIVPSGELPDYPNVRKDYLEIYKKFPENIAGHEAFIYMIGTYLSAFTKKDAELAKSRLEAFIKAHPDSPFISSAWGLYAKACSTLNLKQERLEAMIKELENKEIDRANPFMENAGAYWAIATVAEFEVGDFDTARKYYRLMQKEYPRERRNFGAQMALKRMDDIEAKMRNEN